MCWLTWEGLRWWLPILNILVIIVISTDVIGVVNRLKLGGIFQISIILLAGDVQLHCKVCKPFVRTRF